MSWKVKILLRKRDQIRTNPDIDSDDFNDLLIIEKKIEELYDAGLLSDMDIYLLDLLGSGSSMIDLQEVLGMDRITIGRFYRRICDRISNYLGGSFTDEGLLSEMERKYKLSDKEVNILKEYMEGTRQYQLLRSRFIDE